MTRIIPKSSKVKNNFFKGLSVKDLIIIIVCVVFESVILSSNLRNNWIIGLVVLVVSGTSMVKYDEQRIYTVVFSTLLHITGKKKFSKKNGNIKELQAVQSIKNNCLDLTKYKSAVLEIEPIAFSLKSEEEQDRVIEKLASCLSVLSGIEKAEVHFVKLERPMLFDEYLYINSVERVANLNERYDDDILTDKEYDTRLDILASNEELFEKFNEEKIMKEHFYVQCFSDGVATLENLVESLGSDLTKVGLKTVRLDNEQLSVFLKNSYTSDFDERDFFDDDKNKLKEKGYTTEEIYEKIMPSNVNVKYNKKDRKSVV